MCRGGDQPQACGRRLCCREAHRLPLLLSENKLSEASGGRAEDGERSDLGEDRGGDGQESGVCAAVPVDENLFTGEDLDELEEELNTLDLEE